MSTSAISRPTSGAVQNIAVFEHQTEQPLNVAILIDNSGSMYSHQQNVIANTALFLSQFVKAGNLLDWKGEPNKRPLFPLAGVYAALVGFLADKQLLP